MDSAAALVRRWMLAAAAYPGLVLAVVAVLCALAAGSLTRLSIDTDSSRMLSPELPFQARAHALNAAFPELKNQIVVVVRGPRADPVDAVVADLVAGLAGAEGVASVFAASTDPFFQRNGLLYLSTAELEDQLTRLSKSANLLARLREDRTVEGFLAALAEADRLAERADIPADALARLHKEAAEVLRAAREGRARAFAWADAFEGGGAGSGDAPDVLRLLTVSPEFDFARVNPAKAAMAEVERAVAGLDPALAAEVEVGITGDPVLRAEELRSVTSRIGWSLALSLLLVAAVLLWALGSAGRVGLALGALVITLLLTAGLGAATVGALNLVSIAFIVLMVGLGIDFTIHLMAHIEESASRCPPLDALAESADALGPALLLTALTTSAGFLAFAATDFDGMAQLGIIGGLGVLVAFCVTVTVIPAAIALRPGLAAPARRRAVPSPSAGRAAAPQALFWAALGLGVASAAVAAGARFDADPMGLRNPEARSVQVFGWLAEDPDRAPLRLSVLAPAPEIAASTAAALGERPEVHRATWLGDLVPDDQEAKLDLVDLAWPSLEFAVSGEAVDIAAPAERGTADIAARHADTALGAELARYADDPTAYPGLREALFRHFGALIGRLEAQLDVDAVTAEDLPAPLRALYLSPDGTYRVDVVPADDISDPVARAAFVAAVLAAAPEAAGPPAQIEGASASVAGAMAEASALALAVAALLAWAAVGRAITVAAILVPVLMAGSVTLALSVLLGMPLNYANIIVLPLLIGIGVDSGVHLALRAGQAEAVFATSTPRAVAASALTTIGAFATLALSEHRGTASMGTLLAVALVAAVGMAFALTPTLARWSRADRSPDTGDTA